jgi:hypothetical protein
MHGIVNAEINSESGGHWYDTEGHVIALVPRAKPKTDPVTAKILTHRPPTLADAKKLGFLRSWSAVKKIMANRQLEDYWSTQMAQAAWEMLRAARDGTFLTEDFESFKDLLVQQASEHREQAADAGSELHGALAEYVKTHQEPFNPVNARACREIAAWEQTQGLPEPLVEHGFANLTLGFGGTIDRLYPSARTIADVKTVPTVSKKHSWPYEDWPEQLAFYWKGYLPFADLPCRLINLVVSRTTGALVEAIEWGVTHQPSPTVAWERARTIDLVWQMRNKWGAWA